MINQQAVNEFYKSIFEEFTKDLIVLLHITGGSPPRKTELALLRISNDQDQRRNFFLDGTLIYFAMFYHKTTNKSDNFRPTYHFLPPSVSKVMFNFICFLRPAVMTAMSQVNEGFIWPSKLIQVVHAHSPIEISMRFESVMHTRTGLDINFREWRHLVEIYMRQIIAEIHRNNEITMKAIDGQAGRSVAMGAGHYPYPSGLLVGKLLSSNVVATTSN